MPADSYFNQIEQLPLEQVQDPTTFSHTWLTIIIVGTLAIIIFACFLSCCCMGSSRDILGISRFRRDTYRLRPTNPDQEPIELLEPIAPTTQAPASVASPPTPPPAPAAQSPCTTRDAAPTDPVTHRRAGPAVSETAFSVHGGKPVAVFAPHTRCEAVPNPMSVPVCV